MLKCVTMRLELLRYCYSFRHTLGVLRVLGTEAGYFVTMEPPWYLNEPKRSCIPEGTYKLLPVVSVHFGATWEITGVPKRTEILLHAGNFASATEGCILVGVSEEVIDGRVAVARSGTALTKLLDILAGSGAHDIEIGRYTPPLINVSEHR